MSNTQQFIEYIDKAETELHIRHDREDGTIIAVDNDQRLHCMLKCGQFVKVK